ncbi:MULTISPECIES: hypothetical protein [unclassified Roseateles]|uniref:hypothetical protein n=1 Tax=unclassified Roseateles TaxID=2626991 RepID=UPI0006F6ED69|nr:MULTISPECIES: hypothetical protein [unclassified Roseateles]KQW46337.1 hypothetical protein ASC81_07970 [Pelomonas sp. Root405]KRA73387.1 hypothetical protein ASD88_07970 [Pelomonas sp. Root662]
MKALVFAVTLAAFSSLAPAGAARDDARPQSTVDTTTRVAMADAGRLGSASLTALSPGSAWKPAAQQTDTGASFEALAPEVDGGTLLVAAGVLALLLARPLSRALRRLEQQRRATALASTLDHSARG